MKHRYNAKTKLAIFLPIALAALGMQGCRWDDSMYERYVKDGEISKCNYDLLSLNHGKYIKKINDNFMCGDYNSLVLSDTPVANDICTDDEIERAKEAMEYGNCPKSAFNCVPRLIINKNEEESDKLIDGVDMCSDCEAKQVNCGSGCIDLINNRLNCGACGNECRSNETCDGGKCRKYDCPLGQVECLIDGEKKCTVVDDNKNYCGLSCKKCNDDEKCSRGECIKATECNKGLMKCFCDNTGNGNCTNTERANYKVQCIDVSDSQTCGATDCEDFGKACKPGEICKQGKCDCAEGLIMDKKGNCLNPKSENSCGVTQNQIDNDTIKVCGDNEYCDGLDCACISGTARNDETGLCIDILHDDLNCGEIGNKCGEKSSCLYGTCVCELEYAMRINSDNRECIKPELSDCCGFMNYRTNNPKEICDQQTQKCVPDGANYKCICKHSDADGNCIDVTSNNYFCGSDGDNCEAIGGIANGAMCIDGKCVCNNKYAVIKTNLDGKRVCAEIDNDPECCGDSCEDCSKSKKVCYKGNCISTCPSDTVDCGKGRCLDIKTYHVKIENNVCVCTQSGNEDACPDFNNDPSFGCRDAIWGNDDNCGICGNKCRDDQVCGSGKCRCDFEAHECTFDIGTYGENSEIIRMCIPNKKLESLNIKIPDDDSTNCMNCQDYYANVDGDWANGCEVDLRSSINHCGTVGYDCNESVQNAVGISCDDGKCIYEQCSDYHFMNCNENKDNELSINDGCEQEIDSSKDHCGKCNNKCEVGDCYNGKCCTIDTDIRIDKSLFSCCEGYNLYKYSYHLAFPACWHHSHYACSKEDLSKNSCWERVQ